LPLSFLSSAGLHCCSDNAVFSATIDEIKYFLILIHPEKYLFTNRYIFKEATIL